MRFRIILFSLLSLVALAKDVQASGDTLPPFYVDEPVVNLRAAPDAQSDKLATLARNTTLHVLSERNGWFQVLSQTGSKGWVRSDLVTDTVIRIHKKEQTLTVSGGTGKKLAIRITPGQCRMPWGRYYLSPAGNKLTISHPNRNDLRAALKARKMNYPAYRQALTDKGRGNGNRLTICPEGNNAESCTIFIDGTYITRLKKAIPDGARLEIYTDKSEDRRINGQDALSLAILDGALQQLRSPAVGLRPDARLPSLSYPGGDIQPDFASSTDIVIRAARHAGVDLQPLVHEDILLHPERYSALDLGPDHAASHRLIPVLRTFMRHNTLSLPVSCEDAPYSFEAGDIVFISTDTTDTQTPNLAGIVTEEYDSKGLPLILTIGGMGQHTAKKDLLARKTATVTDHFRMTHIFDYQ